jgi:hypothetical protein
VTDRFCSACGAPVEPDAHFCPHCGHPLGDTAATEPVAAPPPTLGAGASVPPTETRGTFGRHKARNLLLSAVATVVVIGLAIGIALLLTRPSSKSGELFLEQAASTGADPFTDSTDTSNATSGTAPTQPTTAPSEAARGQAVVGTVDGGTAGLYGGTLDAASCDREKQISFLQANPDKAAAFASALSISADQIPDYIGGLTTVVLRHDTRVTNHGFVDGSATSLHSVLQAGTAVLVDKHGIPRVRCMCGNPLTPPAAIEGNVRYQGPTWPGFALNQTVVIRTDTRIDIDVFVLVDIQTGEWFDRPSGTDGTQDRPHDVGGTTAGGGATICASTSEGAAKRLLEARRRGDRADAAICASVNVVDYLWGLSDDFARSLTLDHCELADPTGVSNSDRFHRCFLSNNAFLVGYQISLPPASNWIFNGIGLIDGRPSTTGRTTTTGPTAGPTATGSGCGSSAKSLTPSTPAEEVLVSYFNAINARDYATAWSYLDTRVQAQYGSESAFATIMSEHVACVRVLDIDLTANQDDPDTPPDIAVSASLGIQWYKVRFADQYVTPFPAGSGSLPAFWKVEANSDEGAPPPKILDSATGP